MKVSKESLKFVFKRKESYIAFSLLFVFLLTFLSSFLNIINNYKGIRDFTNSIQIKEIFTNNSSTTYAIGDDNYVYYSFNKKHKGHLNNYAGIESLDNEYGDATRNYYNFIKIDYMFANQIKKVDGYRDNVEGNNGYTLILDSIGDLYAIYGEIKRPVIVERNVKDFDVGYENFSVIHYDNSLTEFIFHNQIFYEYFNKEFNDKQFKFVATQGNETTYYVDNQNQLYESKTLIDYQNFNSYILENTSNDYVKKITNLTSDLEIVNQNLYNNEEILQIESIEETTIIRTNKSLYGRGDNAVYNEKHEITYNGIFSTSNEIENCDIFQYNYDVSKIEKMYLSGPFALIIKQEDGFYYTGNLFGNNMTEFTRIEKYGNIDYIIGNYNSVIVLKDDIIYLVNKEGKLENMYDHRLTVSLLRYISLFVLAMILLYIIMLFVDETKRYNRYKNIEVKL